MDNNFKDAVKQSARHRNTITEAIAIWERMDDFDDPVEVMEKVIQTLKDGMRKVLKPDDRVVTLETGKQWTLTDIQYVHNRYQLKDVSGWQYGIDNLRLALDYWVDFALENYKDEDVSRYMAAGLIERPSIAETDKGV